MVQVGGDSIGIDLRANAKQFTSVMSKANKRLQGFTSIVKKAKFTLMGLQQVILSSGLALLFFGMAVKNAAQQALSATIKTFTTVTEGTMLYNQTIGRLSAAFEFLKFSIADAFLTSSLGQGLLEVVINIFDFISGLGPNLQFAIAASLILLVVLGGVMMVAGQILLFFLLFVGVASFLGIGLLPAIALSVGVILGVVLLLVGAFLLFAKISKMSALELKLEFLKALRVIGNVIETVLLAPLLIIVSIINAIRKAAGMSTVDVQAKLDKSFLDPTIAELEEEVAVQRAAKAEKESGTGAQAGAPTFNIENVNANNAEEFVTSLKETSLFNKGAGIA
jgi:hypothetical protein